MSSQGNRTIISHVWLNIVRFLKPEDALNVSMVCRSWYMQFTDQALWEVVCKSILAGYNTEHFMVPYIIETIKRPSPLDGSRVRVLENWTHSWKQRTVYLKHIMYIQSSAVATLRTRTDIFMEVPTDPWCNMEKVNVLERYMAAPLPIDFVIFMAYYAQQLRIVPDPHGLQFTTLASGGLFDDEELWLDFVEEEFNFAVFDQGGFTTGGTEFGNIKDFFCQMTAIPFAQPAKYDFDRFSLNVYLMLSKNLDHYPDILRQNSNAAYIEDLRSMINGAGKVFFAHREFENWCDFRYVAESFTDYMIQYTGVVLEYGMIPPLYQFGSYDMLIPLPRDQSPRQSILLPQPKEWDIGNYLPTYFLCEDNNRNLRSTVPSVWTANPENAAELMVQQIDNPDNILLQNPPECMFRGYSMAKWKPYQDFLSSREKRIKKNTLDDFGRGRLPTQREVHIDMNNDIYDILKSMVDNWKATCPCEY